MCSNSGISLDKRKEPSWIRNRKNSSNRALTDNPSQKALDFLLSYALTTQSCRIDNRTRYVQYLLWIQSNPVTRIQNKLPRTQDGKATHLALRCKTERKILHQSWRILIVEDFWFDVMCCRSDSSFQRNEREHQNWITQRPPKGQITIVDSDISCPGWLCFIS